MEAGSRNDGQEQFFAVSTVGIQSRKRRNRRSRSRETEGEFKIGRGSISTGKQQWKRNGASRPSAQPWKREIPWRQKISTTQDQCAGARVFGMINPRHPNSIIPCQSGSDSRSQSRRMQSIFDPHYHASVASRMHESKRPN